MDTINRLRAHIDSVSKDAEKRLDQLTSKIQDLTVQRDRAREEVKIKSARIEEMKERIDFLSDRESVLNDERLKMDFHRVIDERDQALREKATLEDKQWQSKFTMTDLRSWLNDSKSQNEKLKKDLDNEWRKTAKYLKENTIFKRENSEMKKITSGDNHPNILW